MVNIYQAPLNPPITHSVDFMFIFWLTNPTTERLVAESGCDLELCDTSLPCPHTSTSGGVT
jgi:hypothetical protein